MRFLRLNKLLIRVCGKSEAASHSRLGLAYDDPQAARRFAPHNQRMQQPIPSASKLASGLAADPEG
jgi:hypothetical protein